MKLRRVAPTGSGLRKPRAAVALAYAVLLVGVAVALVPFLYVLSTALKKTLRFSVIHQTGYPPRLLGNFESLLADHPFVRWTFNTLLCGWSGHCAETVVRFDGGYARRDGVHW